MHWEAYGKGGGPATLGWEDNSEVGAGAIVGGGGGGGGQQWGCLQHPKNRPSHHKYKSLKQ